MKKKMKKRFPVIVLLVLFLLLQGSAFVFAEEEIDYEQFEYLGDKRPTHFKIKITNSGLVNGLLNGETLEIKEGQTLNKSFNLEEETKSENGQTTTNYNLNLSLKYDARAIRFTGEYEFVKSITSSNSVPDKFLDQYPDGERNQLEKRTYQGPIRGMLTSSSGQEVIDGGNIGLGLSSEPPWPTIYYEFDDGRTSTSEIQVTEQQALGNFGTLQFEITEVYETLGGEKGLTVINTDAEATSGETSASVPLAIVIGLAGAAAAAAGVGAAGASGGAAGGSGGTKEQENGESTYKMVIYKEFGDKIKYNAEQVYVYARMVETNAEGVDIERPDLTGQITIFSDDSFLEVGPAVMSGDYMGASVQAYSSGSLGVSPEGSSGADGLPAEGIISFSFTGEGGTFQNNVKFKMIGEAYISLEGPKLFVLAGSGRSFQLPYELQDFFNKAEVRVKALQDTRPFDLETGKDKEGNRVITARDRGEKKPLERFYESYSCEIIAENEEEYARTVFDVVMCYEGLLPDFLGKPPEIRGYKNEEGEMEKTLIAFKLGLWNEEDQNLRFSKPEGIEIDCTDDNGIYEVIGIDYEEDAERTEEEAIYYIFRAKMSLPAQEPLKGRLFAAVDYNGTRYESETEIDLIPDLLQYEEDFEKEYQNCIYMINTYLPERFRDKKLEQLEKDKDKLGIEDLKLFRKTVWQIAERALLQDKEQYLLESYWWDEVIAYTELVIAMGNIAFDTALSSVGGPLAGFIVAQVKDGALDFWALYVEKPSIGLPELQEFLEKRFIQMVGQGDGAFKTPDPKDYKKLAAWLSCYIIYRVMYHWWFDKDKQNRPIGFVEAINRGIYDLEGKSFAIFFSDYIKKTRFKEGKVKDFADGDQNLFDDAVQKVTDTVADFIDRIKNGGIQFT